MPSEEHLDIIRHGIKAWNQWRKRNPLVVPKLSEASLREAVLSGVDLSNSDLDGVDLSGADISNANLSFASLIGAHVSGADLTDTNISDADLSEAYLCRANFERANFRHADLREADLRGANLIEADFRDANLEGANLSWVEVRDTNFTNSTMGNTIIGDVDLSFAKGLGSVYHSGPSVVGIETLRRSERNLPQKFLREAGIPESFITHAKSLLAAMSPIEFYSCFISYSSKDQEFATKLHADLQSKGVRCWFALEDLRIGDKLRQSLDNAIRLHDKLMVVLSQSSVKSSWVEKEVETAFEKERQQSRTVLFPIRLDDSIMETKQAWAADILRTRHVGDFRGWKDHDSYKKAFERLLRDLKSEGMMESATQ